MTEPSEFDLLNDIARLLRKHGPDVFDRLARRVAAPEFVEQLGSLLSASARVARQTREEGGTRNRSARLPSNVRSSLTELEAVDPEKSRILLAVYDNLTAKTVLPTLQALRSFALHSGLPSLKATTRAKAVVELIEALRMLQVSELQPIVARLVPATGEDARSLENWTKIIFDKDLRTRKAE